MLSLFMKDYFDPATAQTQSSMFHHRALAGGNNAGPHSTGSCRYIGMAPIMSSKPRIVEHLQFSDLSHFYRSEARQGISSLASAHPWLQEHHLTWFGSASAQPLSAEHLRALHSSPKGGSTETPVMGFKVL